MINYSGTGILRCGNTLEYTDGHIKPGTGHSQRDLKKDISRSRYNS